LNRPTPGFRAFVQKVSLTLFDIKTDYTPSLVGKVDAVIIVHFIKQSFFLLMKGKKEKTTQFEWWEEEEYSPGIACFPVGNCQYKKV